MGEVLQMNLKDLVGETTIDNLERITQGLKLLELLEKKIEELKKYMPGIEREDSDLENILQKLLEESKK